MAIVMGICVGLVGPKSENVEKHRFFVACCDVAQRARRHQPNEQASEPGDFDVVKIENMLPARVESMVLKSNGGGIVRPKRARKQEINIFASDFACPRWARRRQPNEQASEPGDFDVVKIENGWGAWF